MFARPPAPVRECNLFKARYSILRWCDKPSTMSRMSITSPRCRACGCRTKRIFTTSIATAPKSSSPPRARWRVAIFALLDRIHFFGAPHTEPVLSEDIHTTPDEMPGPYTHSKLLAEQVALLAATSGFPVVVANPTMPIGHHEGNFTPPTLMVRYFLSRRIQIYFDFVLNLVDVRDVAAGLLLAMERGQVGGRYILGGEDIPLGKLLEILSSMSGRKPPRVQIPAWIAQMAAATMEFLSDHVTHGAPAATVEGVLIASRSKPLSMEKCRGKSATRRVQSSRPCARRLHPCPSKCAEPRNSRASVISCALTPHRPLGYGLHPCRF